MKKLIIFILICASIFVYFKRETYFPIAWSYLSPAAQDFISDGVTIMGNVLKDSLVVVDEKRESGYTWSEAQSEKIVTTLSGDVTEKESFSTLLDNTDLLFSEQTSIGIKLFGIFLICTSFILANMISLGIVVFIILYLVYRIVKSIYFPERKKRLLIKHADEDED